MRGSFTTTHQDGRVTSMRDALFFAARNLIDGRNSPKKKKRENAEPPPSCRTDDRITAVVLAYQRRLRAQNPLPTDVIYGPSVGRSLMAGGMVQWPTISQPPNADAKEINRCRVEVSGPRARVIAAKRKKKTPSCYCAPVFSTGRKSGLPGTLHNIGRHFSNTSLSNAGVNCDSRPRVSCPGDPRSLPPATPSDIHRTWWKIAWRRGLQNLRRSRRFFPQGPVARS